CDLAEVIGSAVALNLLFGIPLLYGGLLTACDVLVILFLMGRGFRYVEALVISLVGLIGTCFVFELAVSQPAIGWVLGGLVPPVDVVFNPSALFIAIGILGATVMPHNLYLHSAIVQTRDYDRNSIPAKREAIRHATIDSTMALSLALFVNAAILILA